MGMDVFGRNGNYFRANIWIWPALMSLVAQTEILPQDLVHEMQFNNGVGPNARQQITATGASLDGFCGGIVTEETARKSLLENKIIDLHAEEARYGRFEELEDFLVARGIHFTLHCEAYCEYEAEIVFYRGGKRVLSLPSDQSGNLLVCFDDVIAILDNKELNDLGKLAALRKLIIPPETKPLEPIRFV